jgi:hypothetical protein
MSRNLESRNGLKTSTAVSDWPAAPTPLNGISQAESKHGLSRIQALLAAFFLLSWLYLFAGGITMDTTKFRCVISPDGVRRLAEEASPGQTVADKCKDKDNAVVVPALAANFASTYVVAVSWLAILLFFLPLNLAMVSATAGALGAIGNKAHLEPDDTPSESQDNSSPLMSGLLRGLFVYLFFISGLLLFDDKPFSSPGPGQYIRLAGFVSLISFLVNYRPHLFASISDWAYERLNSRKVVPEKNSADKVTFTKTTKIDEETKIEMPDANSNGEKRAPSQAAGAAVVSPP